MALPDCAYVPLTLGPEPPLRTESVGIGSAQAADCGFCPDGLSTVFLFQDTTYASGFFASPRNHWIAGTVGRRSFL